MRLITIFISAALLVCLPVSADVISPESVSAVQRLGNNPNAFDQVDNFCLGKKPKDACLIPGSIIAGGGKGICVNEVSRGAGAITMSCVRQGTLKIDRDIPCHPHDLSNSNNRLAKIEVPVFCESMLPIPTDKFCRDKKIGNPCTVKFIFEGKAGVNEGVCIEKEEVVGEHHPHAYVTRKVISCESQEKIKRQYTTVPLREKLFQ